MDINDLNAQRPEIVFNISETERVYTIESVDKDRNIRDHREIFLFYDSPDTLITLARYNQSNFISGPGGMIRIMSILGRLHVELLPERRLVYVHSYHDSEINVSEALYTLTILSLDTFQKTFITHPFTPFAFEWEPMVFPDDYIESNPDRYKRTQEMDEITADFLAERKYQSPVSRIIVDGEFIFAFTATVNDSSEVLVDIFDGNSGKYLSSAFFPGSYNSQIRNGYFYQVNNYIQTDVFPKIEKYKIDPRVYGK